MNRNRISRRRYFVHESSHIEDGVRIGSGTSIWYFCHVMKGARIGKNCLIGQNVFVDRGVRIGDFVKLQNNVSVYAGVTLEDYVFCGPSVVFTNVLAPRSRFPTPRREFLRTRVRVGATIGANATVVCGNTIGRHALVGAGAVVTRTVPDHALVYGNPARLRGWVCECGGKLEFKDAESAECGLCRRRYKKSGERVARVRP